MTGMGPVEVMVLKWLVLMVLLLIASDAAAQVVFANVGPRTPGPVNTDAYCKTQADLANFPETTPNNVDDGSGWSSNNQTWTTPSYFYKNAARTVSTNGSAYANSVNGNYTGSTQDIIRWSACKWGVDEAWDYAETAIETGTWVGSCAQAHGATGCQSGGDCGHPDADSGGETPNLSVTLNGHTFPITNSSSAFIGTDGINQLNANGHTCASQYPTYGIIQNKIGNAEWYTWPMAAISTAFSEDWRWAKWRACMNGDFASYYTINGSNVADYNATITAARTIPAGVSAGAGTKYLGTGETNLQYLALGCLGTHYSGSWYYTTSDAISYFNNFVSHLNAHNWPGGRTVSPKVMKGPPARTKG